MGLFDRLFGRLEAKTVDRTSEYFWDSIRVFCSNRDPIVWMAALAAAKKAGRDQRASLVRGLRSFADDEDLDLARMLNELADEIAVKDWTIGDAVPTGLHWRSSILNMPLH